MAKLVGRARKSSSSFELLHAAVGRVEQKILAAGGPAAARPVVVPSHVDAERNLAELPGQQAPHPLFEKLGLGINRGPLGRAVWKLIVRSVAIFQDTFRDRMAAHRWP